ncbi:hypothetical protein [Photorhabdus heterorhabditis]|uniref:Uncharacterized protein n=1 Tax=Photorhabdus heterorhabditis TaxID=880156 RepID=A0ABR5KEC2_9GAMM|nr:hypothetical protein [Photorhabdus heterorhabditis]KOY62972.1 hypothetical protein AM629_05265 [Photorhabdus heterorhabditis]MBS9441012.1 hypothetical protein [Photorhabdus heterorhabditis]
MNEISIPSLHFAIPNEFSDFQEMMTKMSQEEESPTKLVSNESIKSDTDDEIIPDEEMAEIIIQYMITNNTIKMLKQHQEAMKEILDEE